MFVFFLYVGIPVHNRLQLDEMKMQKLQNGYVDLKNVTRDSTEIGLSSKCVKFEI